MKVILCGPPHSGKSCLREGLKQAMMAQTGAPYPYVITANPDGEGAWFQAAVSLDRERALQHKASYKGLFTDDFGRHATEWVANCALPLVLVDLGGRTTDMNSQISAGATHAILLAGNPDAFPEWREFCGRTRLNIIAELHSDLNAVEDILPVQGEDGIWRGTVHGLKRGVSVKERPVIQFLAEQLSQMTFSENISGKQDNNQPAEHMVESSYQVALEPDAVGGPILWIKFLGNYQNNQIVRDAKRQLDELASSGLLQGATVLRISGPASLPVMATITHAVAHTYEAVAVYDPKLDRYVVAVAHGGRYQIGDLIE